MSLIIDVEITLGFETCWYQVCACVLSGDNKKEDFEFVMGRKSLFPITQIIGYKGSIGGETKSL